MAQRSWLALPFLLASYRVSGRCLAVALPLQAELQQEFDRQQATLEATRRQLLQGLEDGRAKNEQLKRMVCSRSHLCALRMTARWTPSAPPSARASVPCGPAAIRRPHRVHSSTSCTGGRRPPTPLWPS